MSPRIIVCLLLSTLLFTGCQSTRKDTGMILGGIAGGLLGNQVGKGKGRTAAIIVGAIAGAYIGGAIGKDMDREDRHRSQHALEHNKSHETTAWQNPDSGHSYEVTPTNTYETASGYCREYTTEAVINGRRETVFGTACRQPDGSWQASN